MSFIRPPQPQVIVQPPEAPAAPAPPPQIQAPQGSRPKRRSQQPTFLGEAAAPSGGQTAGGGVGQNTLIGQ